jgi:predicted TIM-barrel fold metal-dependent hydrolase
MTRARPRLTRRALLQAAGGTLLSLATRGLAAQAAPKRHIDVHNHYAAPAFNEFNRRFAGATAPLPWNLAAALRDMDESGTGLAVLSGFTPSAGGTLEDRAQLARASNEFGAQLVRDHPGRFALFGTLPLPDIDASVREAVHALDVLGAVGLTVYTDAGRQYLGDEVYFDLYSELDRRQAVVFVHPHSPDCCSNLVPKVPDTLIEYGTATTRTIAGLVFGGATRRFPRIKWIFSHGGGTMPYLIERFLGGARAELAPGVVIRGQDSRALEQPPGTALAELRKLHYDTAQIANPVALQALKSVVGASQVLYGTDAWFRTQAETTVGVATSGVFSDAELAMVMRGNALRLMPALAAPVPG